MNGCRCRQNRCCCLRKNEPKGAASHWMGCKNRMNINGQVRNRFPNICRQTMSWGIRVYCRSMRTEQSKNNWTRREETQKRDQQIHRIPKPIFFFCCEFILFCYFHSKVPDFVEWCISEYISQSEAIITYYYLLRYGSSRSHNTVAAPCCT